MADRAGLLLATGISEDPLDISTALAEVADAASGGIALFIGTVRSTAAVAENQAREVLALEYEAHPSLAPERLQSLAVDATRKWELNGVWAKHRTGRCELGEPTVVVACAAAHRADALEACRWLIDEIKATVPLWKREVYADGSAWVGAETG